MPCGSLDRPLTFPHYWVGPSYDGLRLSTVIWECGKPFAGEPIRPHGPTYIYENCNPFDAGCDYVGVQMYSTPSIERNKASLDITGEDTSIKGVPATWYEGGSRLEVYFEDTTLVISGSGHAGDRDRIERFIEGMRPGPRVLTDLERYGTSFPEVCLQADYCQADSRFGPGSTPAQIGLNVLAIAIPIGMIAGLVVTVGRIRRKPRST